MAELRAALQQVQTRMAWLHSCSPASSHKATTATRWLRDQRRRCAAGVGPDCRPEASLCCPVYWEEL